MLSIGVDEFNVAGGMAPYVYIFLGCPHLPQSVNNLCYRGLVYQGELFVGISIVFVPPITPRDSNLESAKLLP